MSSLNPGAFSPGSTRGYVNLADGRRLSYIEWGHPAGEPVLEFRGLPSSRSGDAIDLDVLARARVRRITVDRPGLGFSDPQPGRTVLDWPAEEVWSLARVRGHLAVDEPQAIGRTFDFAEKGSAIAISSHGRGSMRCRLAR